VQPPDACSAARREGRVPLGDWCPNDGSPEGPTNGGFGSLIALPLQKRARERGNSAFIDDQLVPYPDQWAFLSSVRKLDRHHVEGIVAEGDGRGGVLGLGLPSDEEDEPWRAPPSRRASRPLEGELPHSLELIFGNEIYIPNLHLLRNSEITCSTLRRFKIQS